MCEVANKLNSALSGKQRKDRKVKEARQMVPSSNLPPSIKTECFSVKVSCDDDGDYVLRVLLAKFSTTVVQ